ncbi:MAG: transcriptional regulator, HxlR family [Microbacterium sp.]|jgi:DNA-binding HxlR family transcriptional regulator|uniref:winged helix-turn-helix transcriptional regulator n=1 Tax=Microbacterium sp. TaxID=51671 RepID=UPI002627AD77|nr:helix-turn-helix domain-containing protein [Microbacterium sp.]MDF2559561.1 transcriptional regulator, HxlR family [Microbacterium sp.]
MVERTVDAGERMADCRVRAATDVLSHRWDGVILAVLGAGPHRRVELRAAIGQVKDKPLTEALSRLIAANLVARRQDTGSPSINLYELTPLGRSFHDGPLQTLATWAAKHGEQLLDASTCTTDPADVAL